MNKRLKWFYIALLLAIVLLSWLFSRTSGLVYGTDRTGSLLYTSDLASSGANDNISIETGMFIFLAPLILRLVLWKKTAGWVELLTLAGVWLYEGVLLLTLDSASMAMTVFRGDNLILALWTLSYLSVMPLFLYLWRDGRRRT